MIHVPVLSPRKCAVLLEIGGNFGHRGHFDPFSVAELFEGGLIEVRRSDGRLALTRRGAQMYRRLAHSHNQRTADAAH